MAKLDLILFKDVNGRVPVDSWLGTLRRTTVAKCLARLTRLTEMGHLLKRPEAAYLRDRIYELRFKDERTQYRILYFFHENQAVVATHGIVKKTNEMPEAEIDRALARREQFMANPTLHTFRPGV